MAKPMRKLLIVTTGLGFGGAEAQLSALARAFHGDGEWTVEIASMLPLEGWADELTRVGIPLHDLQMKRRVGDPRAVFKLAKIINRYQPDLVHAHMVHANLLSRVTRLIAPVPVLVCTAHGTNEGPRWREFAYRATDRLCEATTQVSLAGAERYVSIGATSASRMHTIPNGVDTQRYAPSPETSSRDIIPDSFRERFVFLAVGRLEPPKDYGVLIAALKLLRQRFPTAAVIHLGSGPLEYELRSLVQSSGLADDFFFAGLRRDVVEWMRAADAMVMSSCNEGLPLVLLEGMSTCLVPVATNVGGIPEIITPGKDGFLVPAGDPDALAKGMNMLMDLPLAERRQLGRSARRTIVERYSLERVVQQWRSLYATLLGELRSESP